MPALNLDIYISLKISLKISLVNHEENTYENYNRVVFLNVIKTRLFLSSNFCDLENINFPTFMRINALRG